VAAGGIKAILADYFKHNKQVYNKFKKTIVPEEETKDKASKKRVRRDSTDSRKSVENPKKR